MARLDSAIKLSFRKIIQYNILLIMFGSGIRSLKNYIGVEVMCTGEASAEDVHPFQSCQQKMNPSDFIFPKVVDKKLRVQIASIFGGMGVGDKNGRWPVKKK